MYVGKISIFIFLPARIVFANFKRRWRTATKFYMNKCYLAQCIYSTLVTFLRKNTASMKQGNQTYIFVILQDTHLFLFSFYHIAEIVHCVVFCIVRRSRGELYWLTCVEERLNSISLSSDLKEILKPFRSTYSSACLQCNFH